MSNVAPMPRGLTFYADTSVRRIRQVVGDLLVLAWVAFWTMVGQEVYSRAKAQGQGSQQLETAGTDFSEGMGDAGSKLSKVPIIGDDIQKPFDQAASAGNYVAAAGRDIQVGTVQLGQILGTLTAALPICLVVAFWAQARWRYSRKVRIARALDEFTGADVQAVRIAAGLDRKSLGLRPVPTASSVTGSPAERSAAPEPVTDAITPGEGPDQP